MHICCVPTLYYLGFFSSWRAFYSLLSGFLLSMGFSPGLCRATTDLNQFLYVWYSHFGHVISSNLYLYLYPNYTVLCAVQQGSVDPHTECHNSWLHNDYTVILTVAKWEPWARNRGSEGGSFHSKLSCALCHIEEKSILSGSWVVQYTSLPLLSPAFQG